MVDGQVTFGVGGTAREMHLVQGSSALVALKGVTPFVDMGKALQAPLCKVFWKGWEPLS